MEHVPFKFIKATTNLLAQDPADPDDSFEEVLPESPFSSLVSPWSTQYDHLPENTIHVDIKENGEEVTYCEESNFLEKGLHDPKTWKNYSMQVAVVKVLAEDNEFHPPVKSRKLKGSELNKLGKFFATMKRPLNWWTIYNMDSLPQTIVDCLEMCPWIKKFLVSKLTSPFLDPPILRALEVGTLLHLHLIDLRISLPLSSRIIDWVQTKNFQSLGLENVEMDFGDYNTLIDVVYEIAGRLAKRHQFHEVIVGDRYEQVQPGKICFTFDMSAL
ncbi:hypothetical protein L596_026161 [Steinernema carpocapsae]|uniref:Uncharacterized protein n=1 Tax=Steinernema carpocapsae TaxID=34508 RepID=A0A4U5M0L1_STECR|nr:hypothetical protein L596_026161 [Steinernema carpocapsae]